MDVHDRIPNAAADRQETPSSPESLPSPPPCADRNDGDLAIAPPQVSAAFRLLGAKLGSARGRAHEERGSIVIEDVRLDRDFGGDRGDVAASGLRAVPSTPLASRSPASSSNPPRHFPGRPRSWHEALRLPTAQQRPADEIAERTVEAARRNASASDRGRIDASFAALKHSVALLARTHPAGLGDETGRSKLPSQLSAEPRSKAAGAKSSRLQTIEARVADLEQRWAGRRPKGG